MTTPKAVGAVGYVKTSNETKKWLTRIIAIEFSVFLLGSIIYDISPALSSEQRLSRQPTPAIGTYLKGNTCALFYSPFDVYLNAGEQGDYVPT